MNIHRKITYNNHDRPQDGELVWYYESGQFSILDEGGGFIDAFTIGYTDNFGIDRADAVALKHFEQVEIDNS